MPKGLTEKRLMNITLFYLSQYETSELKLRNMLKRRIRRMKMRSEEIPEEAINWLDNVVQKVKELGYLDDNRYAENQMRILVEECRSDQYILAKIKGAGVPESHIRELLGKLNESELERAKKFADKKQIGPFRPEEERGLNREKDMATFARAGFSYDTVLKVMTESGD